MSLSMSVSTMVGAFVRQLLIEAGGRDGEALHFHLDCGMGYYKHCNTGGPSYTARRGLHLLYHCRYGRTVSVFSAITDSAFSSVRDVTEWKHESTHDTCWRDDVKAFAQVYFDMVDEINRKMTRDGRSEVCGANMSEHNSFPVLSQAFGWVPVEVTTDPTCEHNHRKLIRLKDK